LKTAPHGAFYVPLLFILANLKAALSQRRIIPAENAAYFLGFCFHVRTLVFNNL